MLVVSDTSPITSLVSIGKADILRDIYTTVVIPEAVASELRSYHEEIPPFIEVIAVEHISAVQELSIRLDRGEAEAIILARETHADHLLMDEALGRSIARAEKIPVVGLVGILLIAKKRGLLSSVSTVLDALEEKAGFYLSEDVKFLAIQEAGE